MLRVINKINVSAVAPSHIQLRSSAQLASEGLRENTTFFRLYSARQSRETLIYNQSDIKITRACRKTRDYITERAFASALNN